MSRDQFSRMVKRRILIVMLLAMGAASASGHDAAAARECTGDFVFAANSPDPARYFTRSAALAGAIRSWAYAARPYMPANLYGDWNKAIDLDFACNRASLGANTSYWSCEVKARPCWDALP